MRFISSIVIKPEGEGLKAIRKDADETGASVGKLGEGVSKLAGLMGPAAQEMAEKFEGVGFKITGVVKLIPELGAMLPVVLALAAAAALLGAAWAGVEFFEDVIQEGMKTQVVVEQLNQSIRSNGSYSGLSAHEMIEYADSLSVATGKSKDLIISAETVLARFSKLGEEGFKAATKFSLDYAQASGKEIPEAALKIGAALAGNTKSFAALKDIGIVLSKGQKQTLQDMIDTGDTAKYQAIVFDLLKEKIGGAADAYALTLAGGIGKAKNELALAKETIASEVIPSLEDMLRELVSAGGGWKDLHQTIQDIAHSIGDRVRLTVYGVMATYEQWAAALDGLRAVIANGFAEIADSMGSFVSKMAKLPGFLGGDVWKDLATDFKDLSDGLADTATEAAQSALKHGLAYQDLTQKIAEHRLALEGDTKAGKAHGAVEDEIASKLKNHAAALLEIDKITKAYADKVSDLITQLSFAIAENERLAEALKKGLPVYEQTKEKIDQEKAVHTEATKLIRDHRMEIEALEAIQKKALSEHDAAGAARAAQEIKDSNVAYEDQISKVSDLATKNFMLNLSNQQVVAVLKTNVGLDGDLAKAQAALSDAQTQTSGATAELAIHLAAQNSASAEGFKLGTSLYNQEVERQIIRRQEITDLDRQRIAQDAVNEAQKALTELKANFADWQAQTAAEAAYGTELAGIIQKYGLLSKAIEAVQIEEEILNRIRAAKLDPSDSHNAVAVAMIRIDVEGEHEALDKVHATFADAEIAKWVAQPWKDAWASVESSFTSTFNTMILTGRADWKSFLNDFLSQALQAIEQWLIRWLQAIAIRDAADKGGTAASGGGLNLGSLQSLFGGGGGTAADFSDVSGGASSSAAITSESGGSGASSATGAMASMGITIGVFVAIYALANNWLQHHQREFEQIRITAGGPGDLGSSLGSATAAADHLGAVATQMIQTVSGIVNNLGAVIEGWSGDLTVSRSGHGKSTQYWVQYADGLIRQFGNDATAAVQFATVQALRQSNIAGLPAEVRDAIHNSAATTVEQINAEITAAYQDVTARLGDVGSQVYAIFTKYASGITDRIKAAFTDMQAELLAASRGGAGKPGPDFGGPGNGPADDTPSFDASSLSKADTAAIAAQVQAVTDLIASRNREVEAIRNSLIGVDDSGAKRLSDIASFNRGIAESTNLVQGQVQLVQQQLDSLANKSGDAADHLRAVLQGYLDQLNKIPQAISGQQLDMAVFNVFDELLPHTRKYDEERIKYAKMEADAKLQELKLTLIGMGLWDQWAATWQDAYNQAMQLAGKPPSSGSGGGNNRQQAVKDWQTTLQGILDANNPLIASYHQLQTAEQDLRDKAKAAHASAAQLAAGLAALDAQFKASLRQQADDLAHGSQSDIRKRFADVDKFFSDLAKIPVSQSGIPKWQQERLEEEAFRKVGQDAIASLLGGAYQFQQTLQGSMDTLGFLHDNLQKLGISAQQFADIAAQFQQQTYVGLLNNLGQFVTDEATKKRIAQINYEMQIAQLATEIEIAHALKAITDAQYADLEKILGSLPKDVPDTGTSSAAQGLSAATTDLSTVLSDAASKFTDLVKSLVDSNRQVLTGNASSLSGPEKYQTAIADYQQALTAAQHGDSAAMANLPGIRDTLLQVAQQYFAGGAGEGLGAGYDQLLRSTVQDFANLVLSPSVQQATMADLIAQQTNAAVTQHQDLMSLRQTMVDLLTGANIGNLIGGPTYFGNSNPYGASGGLTHSPYDTGVVSYGFGSPAPPPPPPPPIVHYPPPSALTAGVDTDALRRLEKKLDDIREHTGQTAARTGRAADAAEGSLAHLGDLAENATDELAARKRGKAA